MPDPLSVAAAAIGITSFGIAVCKSVLDFYQSVKGSRRDIRDMCESIERLQRTLNEVEAVIQRSSHRVVAATVSENLEACRSGLGRLEHKMQKSREIVGSSTVRRLPTALQYPFRETTIAKLREIASQELMGHLSLSINILNLDISESGHQSMQIGFSSIHENIDSMRNETRIGLNEIRERFSNATSLPNVHDIEDRRDKVLKWIAQSDQVTDYHKRACQQREAQTGNWFIQSDRYRRWRDDPGSFYWLHGIPGCGKTVLCSTIIEETRSFCSHRDFHYIAYYYFSFKDAARQKTKPMFRSLMLQILQQQSSVPDVVLALYNGHEHEQPTVDGMLQAFRTVIASSRQIYIIVDALDECPNNNGERATLVSMLKTFKDFGLPNLHLLATSRKESDLAQMERLVTIPPVGIQNKDVDRDILLHVRVQLSNDTKLRDWPEDIKEEVEFRLSQGAHGMFRWASCQLDSLRKCLRASTVQQTLSTLPQTLDETYDQILLNIDQAYRKEALLALMWLLFSTRPLSLSELAEAMVINNSAEPAFSPNDRFFTTENAITILSTLVADTPLSYHQDQVDLAHYSVKEYLTSERALEGPAAWFAIDQPVAQEQITQCCLNYLKYCSLQDQHENFPLLSYAAKSWFIHAKECSKHMKKQTIRMIVNFLHEPGIWTAYFNPEARESLPYRRIRYIDKDSLSRERSGSSKSPTALYYAACLGLDEVVEYLIKHGSKVNEECGRFGNALQAASLKNHVAVVVILLQHGADVNKRGGLYVKALNAACVGGNAEIVRHLIKAGAHAKSRGTYENPLDFVKRSYEPSRDIVMQLLAKNALSHAQEHTKCWLMRWAATSGYEDVVLLLLDKLHLPGKISFNWTVELNQMHSHQSYFRVTTAPYEAIFQRHEAVAKLLIKKWDDVNEKDEEKRTPLYWACFFQCHGIVEALLEQGADVHCEGLNKWTARYWATLFDDRETLRLLDRVCKPSSCAKCDAAESEAKAENVAISAAEVTKMTLDEKGWR